MDWNPNMKPINCRVNSCNVCMCIYKYQIYYIYVGYVYSNIQSKIPMKSPLLLIESRIKICFEIDNSASHSLCLSRTHSKLFRTTKCLMFWTRVTQVNNPHFQPCWTYPCYSMFGYCCSRIRLIKNPIFIILGVWVLKMRCPVVPKFEPFSSFLLCFLAMLKVFPPCSDANIISSWLLMNQCSSLCAHDIPITLWCHQTWHQNLHGWATGIVQFASL